MDLRHRRVSDRHRARKSLRRETGRSIPLPAHAWPVSSPGRRLFVVDDLVVDDLPGHRLRPGPAAWSADSAPRGSLLLTPRVLAEPDHAADDQAHAPGRDQGRPRRRARVRLEYA